MAERVLAVGSRSVEPGASWSGMEQISIAGRPYDLPLSLANGEAEGPTLVVTAGINADEYAAIAAALDLGRGTSPKLLRGQLIVAPIVDTPGFHRRSVSLGHPRTFPGSADGTPSEQVGDWLFRNVIRQADFFVDLHGGDLVEAVSLYTLYHPTGDPALDGRSVAMSKAFGSPYVVARVTSGTALAMAAQAGIPAIVTEAGGQGIWLPQDVAVHREGLSRVMMHLGLLAGPAPEERAQTWLSCWIGLRAERDGLWYPAVACGDTVRQGQELGRITDFWGSTLQQIEGPADGHVLFMVTSLAINAGDPLLSVVA